MSTWSKITIGQMGRVVTGTTPRTGDDAAWGSEIDFITPTEMSYSRREPSKCRRLSKIGLESLRSRAIPAGSILFACIGFSTGKVCFTSRPAVTNQQVNSLIPNPGVTYPQFAYYLLRANSAKIRHIANGSTTPIVNKSTFQAFELKVPDLIEQRAIAATLGALDDKIAANERIAGISEALLRALFNSYSADSKAMRIREFAHAILSSIKPNDLSGKEAYIGLEDMPRNSIWLSSWSGSSGIDSAKNVFQKGDILFGKLRPYFHKVGLAQVDGICSTDIIVVRAKRQEHRSWLLMALSSDETVAHATACSNGTRMPRTKWTDLAGFEIPWPRVDVIARFESEAFPLIQRVEQSAAESRTLAALRDALLPQLMSGQLRVRYAEQIVEDAL